MDAIQLKKDRLSGHIGFIRSMLTKVKGTDLEMKWQIMYKCILSDTKIMTVQQIERMDESIRKVMQEQADKNGAGRKSGDNMNEKIENVVKSAATVPKPFDLGKPVLSSSDIEALMEDNKETEAEQPKSAKPVIPTFIEADKVKPVITTPIKLKPKPAIQSSPGKAALEPFTPRVLTRRVSSWSPKVLPKKEPEKSVSANNSPFTGQSLLKSSYKIPKVTRLTSPDPLKTSISPETTKKLTSINLFESEGEMVPKARHLKIPVTKMNTIVRADPKNISVGSEHNKPADEKEADEKQETIVDEKPEEFINVKLEKADDIKPETSDNVAPVATTDAKAGDLDVKLEESHDVKQTAADIKSEESGDVKPLEDCDAKPGPAEDQLKLKVETADNADDALADAKLKALKRKRAMELKRLQENIVDTGVPLAPRRACRLKRQGNYREMLAKADVAPEEEELEEEKPVVKRRKSVLEESNVKPNNHDESRSRRSMPEIPAKRNGRRSEASEDSKTKLTMKREASTDSKSSEPKVQAKRPARESESSENSLAGREAPQKKELKSDAKEELCEPEEKDPVPVSRAKTTENSAERFSREREMKKPPRLSSWVKSHKRPAPTGKRKFGKSRKIASVSSGAEDEWEDVDEETGTDQEETPQKNLKLPASLPVTSTSIAKPRLTKVSNLSFTYCPSGAMFKCGFTDCKFQSLQKQVFVKHLSSRHKKDFWNGYCISCASNVKKPKKSDGLHVITEFIHLMEDHLLKDPVPDEDELRSYPNPDVESEVEEANDYESESISDIDDDLIQGIDSILNELMPNFSDKSKLSQAEKNSKSQLNSTEQTASIVQTKNNESKQESITTPAPTTTPPKAKAVQLTPSPTASASDTKVISKNIVGRVIPLSKFPGKLFLPNGAPLKILNPKNLSTSLFKGAVKSPEAVGALPSVSKVMTTSNQAKVPAAPAPSVSPTASSVFPSALPVEKTLPTGLVIKSVKSGKDLVWNYSETLCPWLRRRTNKDLTIINTMLSKIALSATYKCMGSTCDFYTVGSNVFEKHLEIHEKLTPNDRDNYMSCAYCNYQAEYYPKQLVDHINKEHGYDKFQCYYCFYRSCVDFNVLTHQNSYHKMRPKQILELGGVRMRNYNEELAIVKKKRVEVVPPIICVFCREVFYVFRTFLAHVNEHTNVLNTKCIKCGEKTTKGTLHKHLVQCHGFGLFQCVYCRFGTSTFEIISSHIANEHPSKLPLFCERSENKSPSSSISSLTSSIDSTCLKHINQQISTSIMQKAPQDHEQLLNYQNKGNVGKNISVRDDVILKPRIQAIKTSDLMDPARSKPQTAVARTNMSFMTKDSIRPKYVDRLKPDSERRPVVARVAENSKNRAAPFNRFENESVPIRISYRPQIGKVLPKDRLGPIPSNRRSLTTRENANRTTMPPKMLAQPQIKMRELSELTRTPEPPKKLQKMSLKPLGLQIESVYSLSSSDVPMTRFKTPSLRKAMHYKS